jgi:hypothetical protein
VKDLTLSETKGQSPFPNLSASRSHDSESMKMPVEKQGDKHFDLESDNDVNGI